MVIFLLERLPRTGDRVKWDGWEFRVMVMDGRRLDRILITKRRLQTTLRKRKVKALRPAASRP